MAIPKAFGINQRATKIRGKYGRQIHTPTGGLGTSAKLRPCAVYPRWLCQQRQPFVTMVVALAKF